MKINKNTKKRRASELEISRLETIILHIFFILFSIAMLYPVLLAVGVSFSDQNSIIEYGYRIIPVNWSLEGYKLAFKSGEILNAYKITILSTVIGTVLSVIIQMLYAYPLSRKSFKGRKFFTFYAYFVSLFSGGMVPWYIVCTKLLHLGNSFWALVLPSIFGFFNVVILRTFINSNVPDEMIEAARIDGCSEMGSFWKMVMPLSKAGMATIGLFAMLNYWNNYYLPMMLINDKSLYNLQYYLQIIFLNIEELAKYGNADAADIPREVTRFAMCVITMGPIVLVYPFFQKYFVKGMVVGSVKG